MKKYASLLFQSLFLLSAGLSLVACGSSRGLLAERAASEAETMREYCRKHSIQGMETNKADSLLAQATAQLKADKQDEAYLLSDQAAIFYRLAIAKDELERRDQERAALKKQIDKDQDQLNIYREILNEMKTMRKP